MAHLVKRLPYKPQDLSLNLQHSEKQAIPCVSHPPARNTQHCLLHPSIPYPDAAAWITEQVMDTQ
ncbi:hypothetical protein LEMLEM_LOCUS2825, partial [Lemmus lemmus]